MIRYRNYFIKNRNWVELRLFGIYGDSVKYSFPLGIINRQKCGNTNKVRYAYKRRQMFSTFGKRMFVSNKLKNIRLNPSTRIDL